MKQVPAFGQQGFVAQILVAGRAPDIGRNIIAFGQNFLGAQGGADNAAAAKNLRLVFRAGRTGLELVQAFDDALLRPGGHRRHGIIFVVKAEVIENFLALSRTSAACPSQTITAIS